jgi:hypothetical protein
VRANDTTQASGGTPKTVLADVWNIAAGFWYYPPEEERIILALSQRLVVSLAGAPVDSITVNGTLVFEEIGQFPA